MLRKVIQTAVHVLRSVGIDPVKARGVLEVPRFLRDLAAWRRAGGTVSSIYPVLAERAEPAGAVRGAYFHQDLLVATQVFERRPHRHIDVGSRVDGFIAHLAVFREVEVLDIRPITSRVNNVKSTQADLMALPSGLIEAADSVSCLHALEHFGLGRYGDSIDPDGHLKGFESLVRLVAPGGALYLSFPVGIPVVEFNAHRVFGVDEVLGWPCAEQLTLERFDFVDDAGDLHTDITRTSMTQATRGLRHGCGIYTFRKRA